MGRRTSGVSVWPGALQGPPRVAKPMSASPVSILPLPSSCSLSHYSVFIFSLIFVFLSTQNLLAAKEMCLADRLVHHDRFIDSGDRGSEKKVFTNMGLKCPFELELVKSLQNLNQFPCVQYKPILYSAEEGESCSSVYTVERLHVYASVPSFFL